MTKTMTTSHSTDQWSQQKLHALSIELVENWLTIADHFDIEMRMSSRKFIGPCPVHGGKKKDSFNLFHSGHSWSGNWQCHTHQCENEFVNTPIGLIRGILSHQQYGCGGLFCCGICGRPSRKSISGRMCSLGKCHGCFLFDGMGTISNAP